jgi:hypothetical protein
MCHRLQVTFHVVYIYFFEMLQRKVKISNSVPYAEGIIHIPKMLFARPICADEPKKPKPFSISYSYTDVKGP